MLSVSLGLVAEIKEIKEKSQKDDDSLLSIAAANQYSIMPNLEFEFTDKDIHGDLFKLLRYSCEEICTTKEQVYKVLRLWTTFMEPLLGVPSRPHNSDNIEDVETPTCGAANNEGESDGSLGGGSGALNIKQGRPSCNGYNNISPKRVDSSKDGLVNGVVYPKANGCKNVCVGDKAAIVGLVNDKIISKPNNVRVDGNGLKSNIAEVPSTQV